MKRNRICPDNAGRLLPYVHGTGRTEGGLSRDGYGNRIKESRRLVWEDFLA